MSGYYRMQRGWQDHELFSDDPYTKRSAWVWMIERAAWRPTRQLISGKLVPIDRGQFAASLRQMGEVWGWGHERVRRFLRLLASDGMIATTCETGQFIITICNYSLYQATPSDIETEPETAARQQRDSSETHKKEVKEVKEDSEANASGAAAPADPVKELFDLGVKVLGPSSRSLIGKARKQHGDLVTMEALLACRAAGYLAEPVEFFIGCLKQRGTNARRRTPAEGIYAGFAAALEQREADCRADSAVVVPLLGCGRA